MFELIVASKAHLEGTWYGNNYLTSPTREGDVFKYKADKRYVELHDALDEVMEIVKDAKHVGVNIVGIQIKERSKHKGNYKMISASEVNKMALKFKLEEIETKIIQAGSAGRKDVQIFIDPDWNERRNVINHLRNNGYRVNEDCKALPIGRVIEVTWG